MTRGIFAIFVDSSPFLNPGEVAFLSSHEFNGDMGPTMSKGKKYAPRFLNGVNSVEELDDLLYDVTQDFKYELPDEESGETFHFTDLIPLKDMTNKDRRWKVYEEHWESEWSEEKQDYEEFQHYDDNPWVKYFNYTNYAYVKNLTKETLFMEGEDGKPIDLASGQGIILHYGKLYVKPDDEEESKESTTPVPPPTRLQQYEEVAKLLHGAVDTIIRNIGIKVEFDTPIPYGIGVDPFLLVAESRFKAAIKDVEPRFLEVNTVGDILKKIDWAREEFMKK